jgi:4-hydroxymandelate oxidase
MVLSTLSNSAVEDVVAQAPGAIWFQLYVYRDRGLTRALVERIAAAGCAALVLTVDAPVLGQRQRDMRNRFTLPDGLRIENMLPAGLAELPAGPRGSGLAAYFASLIDPAFRWSDLAWLRSLSALPIVLKGLVRADDAVRAVESGVDAVVVSNHGGRQLDSAPASLRVLPEIAQAVAGRAEVYLDGGVRRGSDLVKAIALGARAVLIGRPILWGLAAEGENGVGRVLSLLRGEFDNAMALCGCRSVDEITADLVRPRE